MKKLWPILLVVMLAVITVLVVRIYQAEKNLNTEADLKDQTFSRVIQLQEKYDDVEREKLEETLKKILILEWEQDNHRQSVETLRSRIQIKEDWMFNPQKKWKVNMEWLVVEKDKKDVLVETEVWE